MARSHVRSFDVLLNITGASIGRSCVVPSGTSVANVNQHVCIIRPNGELLPEFLQAMLESPSLQHRIRTIAAGGSREGLNHRQVASLAIPYVNKSVQLNATRLRARCDRMIETLRAVVGRKRRFKLGLMHDLLTGRRRFPEFGGSWQSKPLSEVVAIRSGGTPSREVQKYWGGHIPWVTAKDMKRFYIESAEETLTQDGCDQLGSIASPGDVLVLVRGNLAAGVPVGIATRAIAFNQDVKLLQPATSISGEFLGRYLSGLPEVLQTQLTITGHGVGRLDTGQLRRVTIRFPDRQEQDRIGSVLKAMDEEILGLEALQRSIDGLRRGLMQKLLSGDIEVPQELGTNDRGPDHDSDDPSGDS